MATNLSDVHCRAVWDRPRADADLDAFQDDLTDEVFRSYRTCFFASTMATDLRARSRRVSSFFAVPTHSANSLRCE